jgi:hypothetical protein
MSYSLNNIQENAKRTGLLQWSVCLSLRVASRKLLDPPFMFKLEINACQWQPFYCLIKAFNSARKFQNAKVQRTPVLLRCDSVRIFTVAV